MVSAWYNQEVFLLSSKLPLKKNTRLGSTVNKRNIRSVDLPIPQIHLRFLAFEWVALVKLSEIFSKICMLY
uniref:Uncharacterized protein n=1 Tax=Anguilla anguilla TaxID=7936 RepID=A0A0E9X2E4_ANGAN